MIHSISYGGGVNSTAMTLWLLDQGKHIDYIVFADTGAESPGTYGYIGMFDSYLRRNYGKFITTVRSKYGTLYEHYFSRKMIPSTVFPHHIEKFKIRPIQGFYQSVRGKDKVEECIGIDYGELDRQHTSRRKFIDCKYPLIEAGIGREGCKTIILSHHLAVPPKSSCYFCPFQTKTQWIELYRNHPDLFWKAVEFEEHSTDILKGYTLYYKMPLRDLAHRLTTESLDLFETEETEKPCLVVGMCGV